MDDQQQQLEGEEEEEVNEEANVTTSIVDVFIRTSQDLERIRNDYVGNEVPLFRAIFMDCSSIREIPRYAFSYCTKLQSNSKHWIWRSSQL